MKYKNEQIIEQLNLIAMTNGRIFDQQNGASNKAIDIAIASIKARPKGKWIPHKRPVPVSQTAVNYSTYYECSECGAETEVASKYCAWCGVEMEKEE